MSTRRPKRPARGAASRPRKTQAKRSVPRAPKKSGAASERLTTVKVPPPFEEPFLRAQRYVARYFADRVEHPDTATISIAGERYVLMRAASLSVEFVEMVTKLYQHKGDAEARNVANNLLFDLAHSIGKADARSFQQKMAVSDPIDNLSAGPIHFAFSGWAFVNISPESRPSPDEDYFLLYDHPFSFESHSWLAKGKRSDAPVCIMNAGYSSGWCEESFGLPLVAVEIECTAAGGKHCRFIMAPPSRIEEHLARHAHKHGAVTGGSGGMVPEFFQRKRLEQELEDANLRLEQRVERRTQELQRANEQLRVLGSAVENASEGFVVMERQPDGGPLRVASVNRGFTRITGYTAAEVIGRSPRLLRLAADEETLFASMGESVSAHQPFEMEVQALRPDGSSYALEVHGMPVSTGPGGPSHWIAILRDISDKKEHLEALRHQALHDALTGLPNRVLLHDRIEQGILSMRRHSTSFALLFLDLDGFKEINDTFGHHIGDILLGKVGARLRAQLRATDTIARLGGDEFAVLLDGLEAASDAERLGAALLSSLQQPFPIEDHKLVVGASIGIVRCPEHGSDPTTLMRRADVAMYAAKGAHAGVMTYDSQQDLHSPARIQLITELRDSIDSQHLVLHYQPLIEIATGRVVKVEALLRWRRGSGNLLMPGDFLPLVEASEVNDRIARWVIETAIRDCHESGGADMGVGMSVNISPHNLRDAELPKVLAELLQRYSYPPGNFTIEITESGILSEAVLAAGVFQRLRDIGVGLSIDDFGTGYSSLMHLKHLPFTELKVDRSFTHDMLVNPHDAAIVRSTIDLGHELGRTIVAEGVETPETLERLRQYRCDYAQGYFISPPLDKVAMREWMVQRDWGKAP
jgi:diguanylate cyclase (GGDEF)-like protein/PAS domain S-box-containing protein